MVQKEGEFRRSVFESFSPIIPLTFSIATLAVAGYLFIQKV